MLVKALALYEKEHKDKNENQIKCFINHRDGSDDYFIIID